MLKAVIFSILFSFSPLILFGQSEGLPRTYPLEMETLLYHGTYVKVTYTQVPVTAMQLESGMLWQLGANEPAELMTTGDLLIGEDTLAAGAYSIFAIPNDTTWTIIINEDVGMFGTYRYNEKMDLFRVEPKVKVSDSFSDHLLLTFARNGVPESELVIRWMKMILTIPVQIIEKEENE